MTPQLLVELIRERGVTIKAEGCTLSLKPMRNIGDLLPELHAAKAEILAILFCESNGITATKTELRKLANEYFAEAPMQPDQEYIYPSAHRDQKLRRAA